MWAESQKEFYCMCDKSILQPTLMVCSVAFQSKGSTVLKLPLENSEDTVPSGPLPWHVANARGGGGGSLLHDANHIPPARTIFHSKILIYSYFSTNVYVVGTR